MDLDSREAVRQKQAADVFSLSRMEVFDAESNKLFQDITEAYKQRTRL